LGIQKSFKSCVIGSSLIKGQFEEKKEKGGRQKAKLKTLVKQKMKCLTSSAPPFRDLIYMANLTLRLFIIFPSSALQLLQSCECIIGICFIKHFAVYQILLLGNYFEFALN